MLGLGSVSEQVLRKLSERPKAQQARQTRCHLPVKAKVIPFRRQSQALRVTADQQFVPAVSPQSGLSLRLNQLSSRPAARPKPNILASTDLHIGDPRMRDRLQHPFPHSKSPSKPTFKQLSYIRACPRFKPVLLGGARSHF